MELGNSHMSILEHVNARLSQSKYIDKVVFAIPDTPLNDRLASFLSEKQITFYRGSEDDVLARFYQCALKYKPQIVVRATCDNPFVDWQIADMLIDNIGDNDYIGCKATPLGTSVEVFTMAALEEAHNKATTEPEHEHVTPYINQKMKAVSMNANGLNYRLTIDEERDFFVADTIYKELYKGEPIPNSIIYDYLASHQEIAYYNREVHQKQLGE